MELIKNGLDLLQILTPFAATIITARVVKGIFFNKGMRKLKKAKEFQDLFDKHDTSFKDEFIRQDLEESYFYAQTGVNTNEKSIKKYIDFKNKIGMNYTWKTIKAINVHLNLEGDGIQIKLDKWQAIVGYIGLFFGMFLCLLGIGLFYYYSKFLNKDAINDFIFLVSIMMIFMFTGFFFIHQVSSILTARGIQKRLNRISVND